MRQIKNFMKAKKPMWRCGECECITLKCWKENDAFCNCGTSSEGPGVEYVFKDWDDTILKQGSIDEGATPKAPADPTREGYTFTGWAPEVGPLSEDTTYVAQYEINNYTVTIVVSPEGAGTTSASEVVVPYGTEITTSGDSLVFDPNAANPITITPTAETGYEFSSWGTLPETVTSDLTITATFTVQGYLLTFTPWDTDNNVEGGATLTHQSYILDGDGYNFFCDICYGDGELYVLADDETEVLEVTFNLDSGYKYAGWFYYNESGNNWVQIEDEKIPITGSTPVRLHVYHE